MSDMVGKVALVTGAASGIGAAVADVLAGRGAQVLKADIAAQEGSDGAGDQIRLDVASEDDWVRAMAGVARRYGGVDILVNAAGISLERDTVEECSENTWRQTMAVNLDGTFLGCKHTIPAMRARGGGAIINFGSVLSLVGSGDAVAYGASKAGVRLLTKSAALYCARHAQGVRCNLVCPGYVETPMLSRWLATAGEDARSVIEGTHPLGRLGRPEEVAELVAYLASDEAAAVNGGDFAVDGGFLAR